MKYKLSQHSALRQEILYFVKLLVSEERQKWADMHNDTLKSIIICYKKDNATNLAKCRDRKYAQFREYFKNIQKEEYLKNRDNFNIKNFVNWFIKNKSQHIIIPYVKQNQHNKLEQLARGYYKEFKERP